MRTTTRDSGSVCAIIAQQNELNPDTMGRVDVRVKVQECDARRRTERAGREEWEDVADRRAVWHWRCQLSLSWISEGVSSSRGGSQTKAKNKIED